MVFRKIKIIGVVFLILFTNFVNAQVTISGKVTDSINNPISYANVVVKDSTNNKFITGSITNDRGIFTLNLSKGSYQLTVSFIGYKSYNTKLKVISNIDIGSIILKEDFSMLNEVVVVGKKNIIERKTDKLIFNVESSPVKEGFDGIEVLKRAPAIIVDGKDNIFVQNKSATVLINGRKLNISGDDLTNYLKSIDASSIKKIEIQTNASSEMDANVQGGVINIILKEKRTGLFAQLKAYHTQKGIHPNFYSSGHINYGTKKWNIYSTISFNDAEDSGNVLSSVIYNNINRQLLEKGDFLENSQRYNFTIGTTYQPNEKHELGFELYTTKNHSNNIGSSEIDIYNNDILLDRGFTNTPRNINTRYTNASLNYTIKIDTLGGKISFIADYAKQNFNSAFDASTIYEQAFYNDIIERSKTNASTDIISAQLDFNKNIKKIGEFSSGIKMITTNRDNITIGENYINGNYQIADDRTNSFNFSENILAAYLMLSRKIFNGINIKFGLRVENTIIKGANLFTNTPVSQHYLNFFPSIFLSKEFKNKNSVSLNFNRRINRPAFSVLNPYVIKINDFSYQIGNPNLMPQYNNNFEIAYNYKRHSFSVFYNYTTDLITGIYFPVGEAVYYQSQNVGKGRVAGFNYNFGNKIKKWWYLKLGTTLQNQNYYLPDRNFHFNTVSFNISNDWNISKTWSAYLSTYYALPRIYGNLEVADYFSANMMIQKSFFENRLRLRIYIDDIFNTVRDKNRGFYNDFVYNFYQKRNTQSFIFYAIYTIDTNNKTRKKKNKSSNNNRNRL